ncbi:MAG: hypothetical protein M3Z25_02780 [Actinomycetota bacterium]|nr:hypothetical protein [Actinomycetota bacterium]
MAGRGYVERWVRVLVEVRPELGAAAARVTVHTATDAIQSVGQYRRELQRERVAPLLAATAHSIRGVPVPGRA